MPLWHGLPVAHQRQRARLLAAATRHDLWQEASLCEQSTWQRTAAWVTDGGEPPLMQMNCDATLAAVHGAHSRHFALLPTNGLGTRCTSLVCEGCELHSRRRSESPCAAFRTLCQHERCMQLASALISADAAAGRCCRQHTTT